MIKKGIFCLHLSPTSVHHLRTYFKKFVLTLLFFGWMSLLIICSMLLAVGNSKFLIEREMYIIMQCSSCCAFLKGYSLLES